MAKGEKKESLKKETKKTASKADLKKEAKLEAAAAASASPKKEEKKSRSGKKEDTKKKSSSKSSGKDAGKDASAPSPDAAKRESQLSSSSESGTPAAAAASSSNSSAVAASSTQVAAPADGSLTHVHALQESLQKFSDVTFTLHNGTCHAHSVVLEVRCPSLFERTQPKKGKKVSKAKRKHTPVTVAFTDEKVGEQHVIEKEILQKILRFVYADTDGIELTKEDPLSVLKLGMAARSFGLQRLLVLCENHIQSHLEQDNVYDILKLAHDNKVETVTEFCMKFARKHQKEFVANKHKFKDLGMELIQIVTERLIGVDEGEAAEPIKDAPVPDSTLIEDLRKLWANTESEHCYADGFVTLNNTRVYFHKGLLAAHAAAFAQVFPPSGTGDDLSEVLFLRAPAKQKPGDKTPLFNLTPDSFKAMLRFIYYGDQDLKPLTACELAPFSPKFQLVQLQAVSQTSISNNIKADTVLEILKVAYLPEYSSRPDMQEVRRTCLEFVSHNGKSVDLEPLLAMDISISVDILKQIQTHA